MTFNNKDECFAHFDKNRDKLLNLQEFVSLCGSLFVNSSGDSYPISNERQNEMFQTFDSNKDGFIDKNEFELCWNRWIIKILKPVNAIIIVDVQNDFISGSLSVRNCPAGHDGAEVIKPINDLLDTVKFDAVFYSYDWHPETHSSFIENIKTRKLHSTSAISADDAKVYDTVIFDGNPPIEQKLWPRHCVQNTWGSELHKDLKVVNGSEIVYKGVNPEIDSYSAFYDNLKMSKTDLHDRLQKLNVTDVYVCGLCFDICAGCTAKDSLDLGYATILIEDCCRAITLEGVEKTKTTLIDSNGIIINSNKVKDMIERKDIRPEIGYKLLLELKKEL